MAESRVHNNLAHDGRVWYRKGEEVRVLTQSITCFYQNKTNHFHFLLLSSVVSHFIKYLVFLKSIEVIILFFFVILMW